MTFTAFCPTHDSTVLLTRRNMIGFANTDDGPIVTWRCSCGHVGVLGRNGPIHVDEQFDVTPTGEARAATVRDVVASK